MISKVPALTDSGKAMLMRALTGEALTFTRVAVGSGILPQGQDPDTLTQLINEELSITPADAYYPAPGAIKRAVTIEVDFDGTDVEADFVWRELGVFATVGDRSETLYAYINDGSDAGTVRKMTDSILTEQTLIIAMEIGDAQNIGAIMNPHEQYAENSVLQSHTSNKGNPHEVTKAQVGLGNVENYAPGSAPIAFTEPSGTGMPTMTSGETESTLFGKAAKAAGKVKNHIEDLLNPHKVAFDQIAAAGEFTGNGTQGRTISLDFTPYCVLLWNEFGQQYDQTKGVCGGMALEGKGIRMPSGAAADTVTWNSSATALMIVEDGFKVNQLTGADAGSSIDTNESGVIYRYIAFKGSEIIVDDGEEEVISS